ncbi:MAG: TonB-dependent receptor [Armatimonadetes bacterium]|nr:TonB-dependent receptor [Armatimonadota bacterium]
MFTKLKFIILFILYCHILEGIIISGKVFDSNNKPLESVIVSSETRMTLSKKSGYFSLMDVSESDEISFHKIGFEDKTYSAQKIPDKIFLTKKPFLLPGIKVQETFIKATGFEALNNIIITIDEKKEFENVSEILSQRADIWIKENSLLGEKKTISLLGHKSKHTLVMIDGIPMNPSGQAFDISTIPAEIVENIEIIKGNYSGAIAGIININTKRASGKLSFKSSQTFGSFGLKKTFFSYGMTNPHFQVFTSITKSYAKNDFEFESFQQPNLENIRKNNEKKIWDISLGISNFNDLCNVNYKMQLQQFFKELPPPTNSIELFDNAYLSGQVNRHLLNLGKNISNLFINSDFYYFQDNSIYNNENSTNPWFAVLGKYSFSSVGSKLNTKYKYSIFQAEMSFDARKESFEYSEENNPIADISEKERQNLAGFGNIKISKDFFPFVFETNLSSRIEEFSDFNDFFTYRFGLNLVYENWFSTILGGNCGKAFTVPSFYDLFWNDHQAKGNPDLKPEKSNGWQVFSKIKYLNNFIRISYYKDEIDDVIYWFRTTNYWKPGNIAEAEISNFEVESEFFPISFLSFGTSYLRTFAYDKTINEDGTQGDFYDKFLIYTPEYQFRFFLALDYKNLLSKISHSKTGKQYTTRDQLHESLILPEYHTTDFECSLSYELKSFNIHLKLNLNNIFDKQYKIYAYTPNPGFSWQTGLSVSYSR